MSSLTAPAPLVSAAAASCGRRGDVSRLARDRGCSRQRLYRQAHAARAAVEGAGAGAECARPRARQVAADEIFAGRKPVLMTLEQHSLCWLGGRLAPSRGGDEWAKEFRQLPAAEQVTRDGGQGLERGLALANAER